MSIYPVYVNIYCYNEVRTASR